jgi:UDP-N-acetylmuramoyl-L-alanyl-D-glutamate--2,6-diaminopimelate ligase
MKLAALAALTGVRQARLRKPDFDLRHVHCDSRRVDGETGFLALAGLETDGHRFVAAARAAGAPALFVSDAALYERLAQELDAAPAGGGADGLAGVFLVPPGRAMLADLAATLHGHPSRTLRLLGVTGTSGKTTVVHLVAQLLQALGQPTATLGTQGLQLRGERLPSERTTPEAPDIQAFLRHALDEGVRTAAMEVTSIGIALERTRNLVFRAAAFTNLSQDHLDFHGDMEAYREAKFRLFTEYAPEAAVVNLDDATGRLLATRLRTEGAGGRLLTCGLEEPADLRATVLGREDGIALGRLRHAGAEHPFRFDLPGCFNLSNLLVAVGLLLAAGERLEELAPAVAACTGAAGRFEPVPLPAPFTVIVDYAHKPAALELALQAARGLTTGRLHVLFGCGGNRDRAKRPQMGAIAEARADRVVLTSDNPRQEDPQAILSEIAAGMRGVVPTLRIAERRAAIHALLDEAAPGDAVLIAGKGDEAYQETAGGKMPFDDREVVWEWERSRKGSRGRAPAP